MGTRFSWEKDNKAPGGVTPGSFSWERQADEDRAEALDTFGSRNRAPARAPAPVQTTPGFTVPRAPTPSYQHANSALDTIMRPVDEQDVQARLKEMKAESTRRLRDLDVQYQTNVRVGRLQDAKAIIRQKLDLINAGKTITAAEAKRQLTSERALERVKATPQDEGAWDSFAVNTLGWQEANRFQTDPTFRAATKSAYMQTWAEDLNLKQAQSRGFWGNVGEAYMAGKEATSNVISGLFARRAEQLAANPIDLPDWFSKPVSDAVRVMADITKPTADVMRAASDAWAPPGMKLPMSSAQWFASARDYYNKAAIAKLGAAGGNKLVGLGFDLATMAPDVLVSMGVGAVASRAAASVGFKGVTQMAVRKGLADQATRKATLWNLGKRAAEKMTLAPELMPMWADSFARTTSDAIEKGADPDRAALAGLVSATVEMAIEKGGAQKLVREGADKAADKGLKAWAKSVLEEALEEVKQDPLSPASEKFIAGVSSIPLFSLGGDGIIDPIRLAYAGIAGLAGGLAFSTAGSGLNATLDLPGAIRQATAPTVAAKTTTTPAQPAKTETVPNEEAVMWQEAERKTAKAAAERVRTAQSLRADQKAKAEAAGEISNMTEEQIRMAVKKNLPELKAALAEERNRDLVNQYINWDQQVNEFDERGSTPESRAEWRANIQKDLDAYVNAETAAAGVDAMTTDGVYTLLASGAAPSKLYQILESRQTAENVASVKPEAVKPSKAKTVKGLPMPEPMITREISPAVPESTKTTYEVDTSKMLPAFRKKLEETYAKAKPREGEVLSLAVEGKNRSQISKMLNMHPAEVRAVLQMNGVPDLESAAGKAWVRSHMTPDQKKAYDARNRAFNETAKVFATEFKEATTKPLNSMEEQERIDKINERHTANVERVSDLSTGHRFVQQLGRRLGKHVVFFSGGSIENGFQSTATPDTLYIRYTEDSKANALFLLGHEFLHSVQMDHRDLYDGLKKAFEETLTTEQIEKILAKFDRIDKGYADRIRNDRGLLIEEIIADQAGALFRDKTFWNEVYEKDQRLGTRLLRAAKKWLDAILEKLDPEHFDTDVLTASQMKDIRDGFSKIVSDILGENAVAPKTVDEQLNRIGFQTTEDTVAPKYNLRTYDRAKTEELLQKKGFKQEDIKTWLDALDSVAARIVENKDTLDFVGSNLYSALKQNSDKQYKVSLDFSTLCLKRYVMQATMEGIQSRIGRGLNAYEWLEVRKRLKQANDPVSCGLCYVEAKRLFWADQTNKYVDLLKAGVWGSKKTDDPFPSVLPESKLFFSQEGLDNIKQNFPLVFADYTKYIAAATHGKMPESRVAYEGQILTHYKNPKTVAKQNLNAGQRIQSWSDFEAIHLLDIMQAAVDMHAVGLKAHAYTKVPDFVRALGRTGIMINMSLIPRGTGLNAKGELVFDPVEGMPFDVANNLAAEFPNTAGTIAIGVSRQQILALLKDPRIHYVIPYHRSGMSATNLGIMGEGAVIWVDYSSVQNEIPIKKVKKSDALEGEVEAASDKAPAFYEWWSNERTPEENIKVYKALCAKRKITARFSGYYRKGDGVAYNPELDFSEDPNYWKMLCDRRMFNEAGEPIRHEVVRPEFNDEVNADILARYVESPTPTSANPDVVDSMVSEIESGKDFEPSKAEKIQILNQMKRVTLEEIKLSIRAYHGTASDFDQFDLKYLGTGEGTQFFGWGLYFTQNEQVARAYRDQDNRRKTGPRFIYRGSLDVPPALDEALDSIRKVRRALGQYEDKEGMMHDLLQLPRRLEQTRADLESSRKRYQELNALESTDEKVQYVKNRHEKVYGPIVGDGYGLHYWIGEYGELVDSTRRTIKRSETFLAAFGEVEEILRRAGIDPDEIGVRQHTPKGRVYKTDLDFDWDDLLHWEKPFSQQSEKVQRALLNLDFSGTNIPQDVVVEDVGGGVVSVSLGANGVILYSMDDGSWTANNMEGYPDDHKWATREEAIEAATKFVKAGGWPGIEFMDGEFIYERLTDLLGSPRDASILLDRNGIYGVTMPVGYAQGRPSATERNFVAFDDKRVNVVEKYSIRRTPSQYMAMKPAPGAKRDFWTDVYSKVFNKAVRIEQVGKQAGLRANNALAAGGIIRNIIENEMVDRQGRRIGKSWKAVVQDVLYDGEFWDYMLTKHNISRQLEGKPVIDEDPQTSYVKAQQMEQAHPEWVTKAKEIYDWQDTFMKAWGIDAGIIDALTYADWKAAYPHYIPTQREFSDLEQAQQGSGPGRRYVNMPSPVRRATGSVRKIIPPVYSVAQMVNTMVRTAAYNGVGQAMYDQAVANPSPLMTVVPPHVAMFRRNPDNVVTVWKDGVPVFLQINDKQLLDALLNLPKRITAPGFINAISSSYRGLITHRNPIFAALNFARDTATAFVFGDEWNPLRFAVDGAKAAGQIMFNRPEYRRYRGVGGGSGGFFDTTDQKKMGKLLQPGAREKGRKVFDLLTSGLGEVTEQMWRLSAFNRELKKTGDVETALQKAMNVTVNFARGGSVAKALDPYMPYTNAYLQGLDTFVRRMFLESGAPGRWAKAIGIVTAPALLQLLGIMAGGEDEWDRYLSIRREIRDSYFHIPKGDGTYIRIPKSRELGVLFGAMAERAVTGDWEGWWKPWMQNFAPNNPFESNLLGGAWYLAKNETFSGATITPEYMKGLDAELQSDENTSSIMVALAKLTGVGAKDLQFLFDHYTGIIGDVLLPLTAQSGRNTALDVIRRVTTDRFTTDPAYASQGVSDFYEAKDKAESEAENRNIRENIPGKTQTEEERFAARMGDVSALVSAGNKYIRTLKASDPVVREIREVTARFTAKAAKAKNVAELVSITASLKAVLYRLGVR